MTAGTDTPRPAVRAALDQGAAASRDARRVQALVAAQLGATTTHARAASPALARVLRPLVDLDRAGALALCAHLPGWSSPSYWTAWRPELLRCTACAADASDEVTGTPADFTCDACGTYSPRTTSLSLVVPAAVEDVDGRPPSLLGPVTVLGGLCASCCPSVVPDPT